MIESSTYSAVVTIPQINTVAKAASPNVVTNGKPKITVVVPAMNEAKNLPHVLPRIPDIVDEVVLVDGYSKDDTIEVARRLMPDIRVVMQEGKGKGAALRTGFAAATGDIIVMIDADGSMAPEEIPDYIEPLVNGADFAKGSRFLGEGGTSDMEFYRKLGNWAFVAMVRVLFGGRYTDLCYGYNAFWTRVLPQLNLDADGFEIETLMNIRALTADLQIEEVASFEYDRIYGTSNLRTIPDGWRVLKTIIREYRADLGHRLSRRFRRTARQEAAAPEQSNVNPALQLILNEALYLLLHSSKHMSPEACQTALNALRSSFESLVCNAGTSETTGDFDRALQEAYQQYNVRFSFEVMPTQKQLQYTSGD